MTVYVDNAQHKLGRMKMCHLLADNIEELHTMADRLALKRAWFQARSTPHYDICQQKRRAAIALGAVAASRKQVVSLIRKYRDAI